MTIAIDEDRLSEIFGALANSTRRAILARLADGEATVNELAAPFAMKLPAISKHIKVLERAGLVTRGQQAQYRPCALDGTALEEVSIWAERYRPVWEARFDRMDDYLRQLRRQRKGSANMNDTSGLRDAVVIERSFDAPVDLVWQMWTDAEHFKAWYGPDGATIPVARMDVRVGGTRLVCLEMQSPHGPMQMWFTGEYREVVDKTRLVYTETISDEHGNVTSASDVGVTEGHPLTTEVRVELEDVDGRTKMVLTHVGIPDDSPGAAGWAMALDKLAAHLEAHWHG